MQRLVCAILATLLVVFCAKPTLANDNVTKNNPQDTILVKTHTSNFKKLPLWQKAISESKVNEAIFGTIKQNFIVSFIALTLIAISIGFLTKFIIPSRRLRQELRVAKERLETIKTKTHGPVVDLDEVAKEAMTSVTLTHSWNEYRDTLHPQKIGDSGQSKIIRYRATALAESFFTEQSLVDIPLKTEFYKHLPGILTGLGIIGTFAGLIFGLVDFDVSENPSDIRHALESLIQSVGHAFFVSAFAISLAMLFTWREKSHVTERYKQVEELSKLVDSLFDAGAGEEYLEKLVRSSETSATQALQIKGYLVTDLKEILSDLNAQRIEASARHSQQLSTNIAQTFSDSLREPMEKISSAVKHVTDNQGEAVNKLLTDVLADLSSQMEKMFGGQIRGMSDLLAQTTQSIQAAAGKFDELATKMDTAGRGAADAMAERLKQAIGEMETRQQALNTQMIEFVGQIKSITTTSQTESINKLKETLFKLDEHVAKNIGQLQDQSVAQAARQQEQNTKLSGQMESLIAQSLETSKSLQASVSALAQVTSNAITNMNSGAETLYIAANDFAKAGQGVAETMKASGVATEKIHAVSQSLSSTTTSIQQMLEDYKLTSITFVDMVADLKSTVEIAKKEASITTELVGKLEAASRQLGQAELQADEYLQNISKVLTEAHQSFAEKITQTLGQGNSKFHEELGAAVSLLSGSIKDLGDALDGFKGNSR